MRSRDRRPQPLVYGLAVAGLAVLGVLTWDRFGQILVVLAVWLAMLAPLRREPRAFWPLVVGAVALTVAYLLIAPANCTTGAIKPAGGDQVPGRFCQSLAGVDYEREGTEDPSPLPAFGAALGGGLIVAGGLRLALRSGGNRDG